MCVEWDNEHEYIFLENFQAEPVLWNSHKPGYNIQREVDEAWRRISDKMDISVTDLKRKKKSLMSSYRTYRKKVRDSTQSGSGLDEVYKPVWFAYDLMYSFIGDGSVYKNRKMKAKIQAAKIQPPTQEVAPPAESTDDNEDEEDAAMEEEEEIDSEPSPTTHILIKQDPDAPQERRRRQTTHKPRLTRPVKRRKMKESPVARTSTPLDVRLGEALKLLQKADITRQKDECDSFGEYIASSLRKHDDRSQAMIKQAINNILFEQEMKKYSNQQYTVVISGIDENPLILSDDGGVK